MIRNDQLAEELHKLIIKKFPLTRVMVSGPNEIWSADSIDTKELSNDNKDYNYILHVINIFNKYAWSVSLKTKTGSEVAKALESIMTKFTLKNYRLIKALNFTIKLLINY